MDTRVLVSFFSLFIEGFLCAVTIGSDTVPSRQTAVTFLAADGANVMNGFGAFENGFIFENQNTTCTFNDFFPVSKTVDMRQGTLYLLKDLWFDSGTVLYNMGNIYGAGSIVTFADSITTLTAYYSGSTVAFTNIELALNNDVAWKMDAVIEGNCKIDSNNSIITLSGNGKIRVANGAKLILENVELQGATGTNFKCDSDTGSIVLRNSVIRLSNDISFATGSMLFQQDVLFTGTNKLIYSSKMGSTIDSNSSLIFDHGTTFNYAPLVSNRDLLYMTDSSSFLFLNGSTLYSSAAGMRLTRGTLLLDNDVTFLCDGVGTSQAICFGTGSASDDLTIKLLSDVNLTVNGPLYHNDVS